MCGELCDPSTVEVKLKYARSQAYLSTLRQEPEFADRSAGDIVSRLSIDTSILGDSVTSNLSDGLR